MSSSSTAMIYQCETCGKLMPNAGCLESHRQTHLRLKKQHCDICNKDFSVGKVWDKHQALHAQNIQCDTCGE